MVWERMEIFSLSATVLPDSKFMMQPIPRLLLGNLIYTYPDIKAFDVIPIGGVLVLIGDDGLYQYNYSDVKNISLLSTDSGG